MKLIRAKIVFVAALVTAASATPTEAQPQPPNERAAHSEPSSPNGTSEPLNAPCDRRIGNRESQLCAQWHSADAAESSAFWAMVATLIAGGGLIVGGLTMLAAVYAALFARRAANHTADGAKAAWAAEATARQTADRQLRAWLGPYPSATVREASDPLDINCVVQIQNYGHSPATDVWVHIGLSVGPAGGKPDITLPEDEKHLTIVMPGDNRTKVAASFPSSFTAPIIAREVDAWLFGTIGYRDGIAGSPERTTKFCYQVMPGTAVQDHAIEDTVFVPVCDGPWNSVD